MAASGDFSPQSVEDGESFAIDDWLKSQSATWPVGYRYELGGDIENSQKANDSFAAKLPVAGFIIVTLLVAQFNSIRRPSACAIRLSMETFDCSQATR